MELHFAVTYDFQLHQTSNSGFQSMMLNVD